MNEKEKSIISEECDKPISPEHISESRARRKANIFITALFSVAVIGVGVYAFISPKPTYSDSEKRELAKMPEFSLENILEGDFTDEFDLFFSDTFPGRDGMVDMASKVKAFRGTRGFTGGGKTIYNADDDMYSTGDIEFSVDEEKIAKGEKIEIGDVNSDAVADDFVPGDHGDSTNTVNGNNATPGGEGNQNQASNQEQDASNPSQGDTAEKSENGVQDGTEVKVPDTDKKTQTEEKPVGTDGPAGEKRGSLYVVGNTALELYRGNETSSKVYAEAINTYAKYLPEGVRIYDMVVPTHTEFALPISDRSVSNEQRPLLDVIRDNLSERVTFVDPYNKIRKGYEAGEYLYFRSDHHWTAKGAYYAYREFCEATGEIPIALSVYEEGRIEPFLGTFYQTSRDAGLKATPDYVEYYKVDIPCTVTRYDKSGTGYPAKLYYTYVKGEANSYLAFLGGDFPYIKIVNDQKKNGKKLIVFKESYGNPLIPFIVPHYEEVHVADIRYFPYNAVNFITQYGITDVLFVNGLMSASTGARVNEIYSLLNK